MTTVCPCGTELVLRGERIPLHADPRNPHKECPYSGDYATTRRVG
jgi:hypothetical protein